jgi:hypothetical protein
VTREEKIAEAVRLYAAGLSDREIGERLGVTGGAVWKWRHPERTREINRVMNAKRRVEKREWEHRPENRGNCTECGSKRGFGVLADGICQTCRATLWRQRLERLVALRREGLTNIQIGSREGIDAGLVARYLYLAKTEHGMEVPPPPYWSRKRAAA